MFNLYCKSHHSTKILFWNDWTFPEGLVPTNACTLDDYISVREGLLDHHNSRENQGREWRWTDRTDAVIFWLLFSDSFNEGIPLNFTKRDKLDFSVVEFNPLDSPKSSCRSILFTKWDLQEVVPNLQRGSNYKSSGKGKGVCKDITDGPRCLWNFTMNRTLVLPCCNVQAVLSEL